MKHLYKKIGILLCVLMLTGCGSSVQEQEQGQYQPKEPCQLTFLDTGKSDCILIELEGKVILNDTADEDDYGKIENLLAEKNIEKIDYMIISHYDKDHIGSAASIIKNTDVECVLMPDYCEDSNEYKNMISAIQANDVEQKIIDEDYSISTEHGNVYISAPHENSYKDENNFSLITVVDYENTSMLLMGDALKVRTEEFMKDFPLYGGQYDLVKTPHHGDYNKNLKEIYNVVKPIYSVITVDASEERVEDKLRELLDESGSKAYYTYDGDIIVTSDGETLKIKQ